MLGAALDWAERGRLPDWAIRVGIRRLLSRRLGAGQGGAAGDEAKATLLDELRNSPLVVHGDAANEQHYEVPASFFEAVLGPRLKYSCCLYEHPTTSLADAEVGMLELTVERAELEDGLDILELGCGWGSLTLYMAERFPNSRIVAVSNSRGQRQFIERVCRQRGLENVKVETADMGDFDPGRRFDRVVSVEMFEHMRNYELLLRRVAGWLEPDGKLFVHIFCHREQAYLFETQGAANWMGRHFFTGGMMPSEDLLSHFPDDLTVQQQWRVNGLHYWRTCEDWLRNLDARRSELLAQFTEQLPAADAARQLQRWRIFMMACGELFRYRRGEEWYVGHYLMTPVAASVGETDWPLSRPSGGTAFMCHGLSRP